MKLFFLSLLFLLAAFAAFYILHGRAWLKQKEWAKPFFDWIEPIEIKLWKKSESILFARIMMLVGIIPVVAQQLQLFNMPEILALIPEAYRGYLMLIFLVCGLIVEFNRRTTTEPLAITALPEKAIPPEVKEAVKQADEAKAEAVAVVAEAKAEGKV
jgi:hypothetical protein